MKKFAQEAIVKVVGGKKGWSLLLTELQMPFIPSSQAGLHFHPLTPLTHPSSGTLQWDFLTAILSSFTADTHFSAVPHLPA